MPLLTETLRDKYIDDLMRARPVGPIGRRITYTTSEDYDYDKGRYVQTAHPSHERWGYTEDEIFSLGLYNRDDVESYISKRFFEGKSSWALGRKKATFTRRTRRLWDQRIEDIVRKVKRTGGDGIYRVSLGYYSNHAELGHIYAADKEEAQRFANMFFAYLAEDPSRPRLNIEFMRFGTPQEIVVLNAQTISAASEKLKGYEEKIIALQEKIEQQKMFLQTLQMVEEQQLTAES